MKTELGRVCGVVAIGLLGACGGGSSDGDGSGDVGVDAADAGADAEIDGSGIEEVRRVEYEFEENVAYFDETAVAAAVTSFDEETGALVFAAGADGVDAVAAGSVVVGGIGPQTPYGLLRRVTAVETVGDTVVATTEPASLAHAFHSLDVEVAGELPAGTMTFGRAAAEKAGDSSSFTHHFGGDVDWVVFDGDDDVSTTDDQVRISGVLDAWAGYGFGFSYDLGVLDGIDFSDFPPNLDPTDIDLRLDYGVDLGTEIDLTMSGAASLSYEKEIEFGRIYLTPFGVGPLVFVPVLKATGRIEGGVPGKFSVHSGVSAGFAAAVSFSLSDGFESNFTAPHFEGVSPDADVEITATARVEVDLEIDLLLYGLIGPKAGLTAWAQLDADVTADPCWNANVGLDAFVGMLIEIFSIELVDYDRSFPIGSTPIGSGGCPEGQAFDPPPPWSGAIVGGNAYTQTTDSSITQLVRAVDGTMLLVGQTSQGIFKIDHEGELVWSRGYRRVDSVLERLLQVQNVAILNNGGIFVGTDDGTVLFTDAAGHLESARRLDIGSDQPLEFNGSVVTDDGTVLAVTPWYDVGSSSPDAALVRFMPDGTVDAWRWGVTEWLETPRAIVPWGSGFAMVVWSQSYSETPGGVSSILVLDGDGNLVNTWRLEVCSGDEEVVLRSAVEIADGHLVLGGYQRFSGPRALIVNVAPDGTVGWASTSMAEQILGFDVTSIVQLESGAYMVAGTRVRAAPDDAFIARTDAVGRFAWVKVLGGSSFEVSPALLTHPDGSVVMAVASDSFEEGNGAWWISRLDSRTADLSIPASFPVVINEETFTATDNCITSSIGSTTTVPLTASAPEVEATDEALDLEMTSLVP